MTLAQNDTHYMPLKVLNQARSLGVHESCIERDLEGACEDCSIIFHIVLDTFYGHASNANDALMMILSDIMKDKDSTAQ